MAVAKKKAGKKANIAVISAAVQKAVEELLVQAQDRIDKQLDEAEVRALKINFSVDLDETESEPQIKVGIRFTDSYTDSRSCRLDDPEQIQFFSKEELAEKKKSEKVTPMPGAAEGDKAANGGE
jgi:hypothetical protein